MNEGKVITVIQACVLFNSKSQTEVRNKLKKSGVLFFNEGKYKFYYRDSFDEKFPQFKGKEIDPIKLKEIRQHHNEIRYRHKNKQNSSIISNDIRSKDHVVYESINRIHDLIKDGDFDKVRSLIDQIEKYKETIQLSKTLESNIYKLIS